MGSHGHAPHGHHPPALPNVPHSHTALNHTVHNHTSHTNYSPPAACGTNWGSYVLANSGAADCSSCGEAVTSYNDCATAAALGFGTLPISFGLPWWVGMLLAAAMTTIGLRLLGQRVHDYLPD